MRTLFSTLSVISLFAFASTVFAQQEDRILLLQKKLTQMEQHFEKIRLEQQAEIETLKKQLSTLTGPVAPVADQGALTAEIAKELQSNEAQSANQNGNKPDAPFNPSNPITVARAGSSYMNVSFGTVMDAGGSTNPRPAEKLELGDHDPQKRGFSLRNAELSLDGAVDPYFKGFTNIVFKLDQDNETEIELEESYLQTTSLPSNFQIKGGQFFANFGRQNPQHPHQWAFVDQPLVLGRAFGPEGLRNVGSQISWLAPTPFYTELFLGVFDGQGGTAFNFRNPGEPDDSGVSRVHGRVANVDNLRGPQDLLFTPRLASSFELSDTQTLLMGLSGAFGPNSSGSGEHTQVYGADIYWKWKPDDAAAGFPFVSFQTEGLFTKYGAGADGTAPIALPNETLDDYGFYTQVLWGFTEGWVTGVRGDYVNGNAGVFDDSDPFRGERRRLSPVLTYYPTEFSKIRFQYNYDQGEYLSDAHSFWVQLEIDLGSHAAHKF